MAKTLHTHRGTCQACGSTQAVDNTTHEVAKHGYTVDFGYFSGTCMGSGYVPAEMDVTKTREMMALCLKSARSEDKHAADLKAGKACPSTFERWNRDKVKVTVKRGYRYETRGDYDTLPIEQATAEERAKTISAAIRMAEGHASRLRAHEEFLRTFIIPRHGQPLQAVKRETPKTFKVGQKVTYNDVEYVLQRERWSTSWSGRGGSRLLGYWVAKAETPEARCGALSLKELRSIG